MRQIVVAFAGILIAVAVNSAASGAMVRVPLSAADIQSAGGFPDTQIWQNAAMTASHVDGIDYTTVLVPTDQAWDRLGAAKAKLFSPANKDALGTVLNCNIVSDKSFSKSVAEIAANREGSARFDTVGGCPVFAKWNGDGVDLSNYQEKFATISANSAVDLGNVVVIDGLNAPTSLGLPDILPTRTFSGPQLFPPAAFAAYGILAFPTRPIVDADVQRFIMFCQAFVATLPRTSEVSTPLGDQMVTVWPLTSDAAASGLNKVSGDPCKKAVESYGLVIAQSAINEARLTGIDVSGPGPFLLAWSPSAKKGDKDAIVLVVDLSDVQTDAQAKAKLAVWVKEIVDKPERWRGGWTVEGMREAAKLFVDNLGTSIYNTIKGGGG